MLVTTARLTFMYGRTTLTHNNGDSTQTKRDSCHVPAMSLRNRSRHISILSSVADVPDVTEGYWTRLAWWGLCALLSVCRNDEHLRDDDIKSGDRGVFECVTTTKIYVCLYMLYAYMLYVLRPYQICPLFASLIAAAADNGEASPESDVL